MGRLHKSLCQLIHNRMAFLKQGRKEFPERLMDTTLGG